MAFLRKLNRCLAAKQLQQASVVRERTSVASATAATSAPLQTSEITTSTPGTHTATSKNRQIDPLDLKFNDPVASFKSKTNTELIRAYVVYQLCSVQFLVENNMKVTIFFTTLYYNKN